MTFSNFESYKEWCETDCPLDVEEMEEDNALMLTGLKNADGMIVCEALVSAYDSGFKFGAMFADQKGGMVVIHD